MLKRLLDGGEQTDFILICLEDDTSSEVELLNRFCVDKQTVLLLTDPQDSTRAETTIRLDQLVDFKSSQSPSDLIDHKFTKKETVIVKSLTGLLLLFPVVQIARWLKELQRASNLLIVVLHTQELDEKLVENFSKLTTTTLRIQTHGTAQNRCSVIHSKPGGKVQRSQELYSFSNGQIVINKFINNKSEEAKEEEDNLADSLTTFKIGTSRAEEEVKKDLVLPFFTNQQKSTSEGEVKIGGEVTNKIYYEPDSGDDWDDEDPDDDLDL